MRTTVPFLLVMPLILCSCSANGGEGETELEPPGTVIQDLPVNIEMAFIPAGSFVMGSDNADDEMPPHEVAVSGFYIGVTPITQRQWQEVMGTNPSDFVGDDNPVENVSWEDAVAFAERLSEMTGKPYRLPTEAEWEYAARAGSTTDFHFGNDTLMLGDYAWYAGNADETTHPVGQKLPNAWGLYDVVGNVREWCQDWWDPDFYSRSASQDPINEVQYVYHSESTNEDFAVHASKSGSFRDPPQGHESAHRHGGRPGLRHNSMGFRIARDLLP